MSPILLKGYKHLPVSAVVTVAMIAFSLAGSILNIRSYFLLAFSPFISKWHQWWRFLLFQLQFQNESQLVLGVVLFTFAFKNLERIFGSLKFTQVLLLLYFYNAVFLASILAVLYMFLGINIYIPSGPYGILFGLMYPFKKYTPTVYQVELNFGALNRASALPDNAAYVEGESADGLNSSSNDNFHLFFGNNTIAMALATILFFSEGIVSSPIACLVGYLVGALLFNDFLPFRDSKFAFLHNFYHKCKQKIPFLQRRYIALGSSTDETNSRSASPENVDQFNNELHETHENDGDTPARSLGTQLLDTFRR